MIPYENVLVSVFQGGIVSYVFVTRPCSWKLGLMDTLAQVPMR